jgi:hypothetical protein
MHNERGIEHVAHAAGPGEVSRHMRIAEARPPFPDQLMIENAQGFVVPVLDDAIEQIEIFRRIDNTGRISRAETHEAR